VLGHTRLLNVSFVTSLARNENLADDPLMPAGFVERYVRAIRWVTFGVPAV